MKINSLFNGEIKIISLEPFCDNRGLFLQCYDQVIQQQINRTFVQENISVSNNNVIRGLHYQWDKPMGKMVQCINGSIIDIIMDIRLQSPTLGKVEFIELNTINKLVWIPAGFAHGFLSLENNTIIKYMCDCYYNKNGEGSINIYDKDIKINKHLNLDFVILSDKDKNAQSFQDYLKESKF